MLWIFPRIIQIPWLFSLNELVTFSPITLLQCFSLSPRHQLNESWVCILVYKLNLYQIQYENESVLSHSVLCSYCKYAPEESNPESLDISQVQRTASPGAHIVDIIFHVLLYAYDELLYWHIRIYHICCFPSAYGCRKSMRCSYSPISTLLNNIYKIYSFALLVITPGLGELSTN